MSCSSREPTEIITPSTEKRIIDLNRKDAEKHHTIFAVDEKKLHEVILNVNQQADIVITRQRIARKAANIIVGFKKLHPFKTQNLRTGLTFMLDFLEDNGFKLSSNSSDELLKRLRSVRSDEQAYSKIERFILENLKDV